MVPFQHEGVPVQGLTVKAAKSVVEIWLWGGPSQLETFDPKPAASRDYNGGLKAIPTNVPGMEIHEWWPELASCADLFSVIRSMTHGQAGHESATYLMQTGRLEEQPALEAPGFAAPGRPLLAHPLARADGRGARPCDGPVASPPRAVEGREAV